MTASKRFGFARMDIGQDIWTLSSTQKRPLGDVLVFGETVHYYAYFAATAVAIAYGNTMMAPAVVANHSILACAAASIGTNVITVTLGGTAATLNDYAEGTLTVVEGTGIGQNFRIQSHPAQTATVGTLAVTIYDSVQVALDTTSKATLLKNQYNGVLLYAADGAGNCVGAANVAAASTVVSSKYGWLQTWGIGPGLADVLGVTVNVPVMGGSTNAGRVEDLTNAATVVNVNHKLLGVARVTTASGAIAVIDYKIRGLT